MITNLSKIDGRPHLRAFVALGLPEGLRNRLAGLQNEFGPSTAAARWIAPDLLHITVWFLGEIPADRLEAVEVQVRAAARSIDPFCLRLSRLGAFPHEREPRVIWAGLRPDAGLAACQYLHTVLAQNLAEQGFRGGDKPFSPHITLARVRERATPDLRRALNVALIDQSGRKFPFLGAIPIETVTVMRSDHTRQGVAYTPLAHCPLGRDQGRAMAFDLQRDAH